MSAIERISSNDYVSYDEERYGDVLPYADIDHTESHSIVHNESIIQGRHNLAEHERLERIVTVAEVLARSEREDSVIQLAKQNAGPMVPIEQLAQHQLNYMNLMAAIAVKGSFYTNGPAIPDIQDRFGPYLPAATKGAKRNQQELIHSNLPAHYQADELIAAGFDRDDVLHTAKTTMPSEYRAKYMPHKNRDSQESAVQKNAARAVYRRKLKKKLQK